MRHSPSPGRRWAAGIGAFALIVGLAGAVSVPSAVAEPSEVPAEPLGLLGESAALVLASSEGAVDPVTRTPSWRVPLSGSAGEDVLDGVDEEEKDVHAGVSA